MSKGVPPVTPHPVPLSPERIQNEDFFVTAAHVPQHCNMGDLHRHCCRDDRIGGHKAHNRAHGARADRRGCVLPRERRRRIRARAEGASARVLRGQLYGKLIFCPNEYYARTVPYDPEKENPYKTPALDMDKAVFYIPEEKKFEAEERFCSRTSPVWSIILYALLLGAAFAALSFAAPKLFFTSVFNR